MRKFDPSNFPKTSWLIALIFRPVVHRSLQQLTFLEILSLNEIGANASIPSWDFLFGGVQSLPRRFFFFSEINLSFFGSRASHQGERSNKNPTVVLKPLFFSLPSKEQDFFVGDLSGGDLVTQQDVSKIFSGWFQIFLEFSPRKLGKIPILTNQRG